MLTAAAARRPYTLGRSLGDPHLRSIRSHGPRPIRKLGYRGEHDRHMYCHEVHRS
jgi:hypothetical protein